MALAESLSAQLHARHADLMRTELEAVALRLFESDGIADVTVERIAAEAGISVRTFYRYFPTKDDVLQVRIERRSEALAEALARCPADVVTMRAIRDAFAATARTEDPELVRRWIAVVATAPSAVKGVLGGIQLKSHPVVAAFVAERIGQDAGSLVPTMVAAAVGGVVQAVHTDWYLNGGDLPTAIAEGLAVLEAGLDPDSPTWSARRSAKTRAKAADPRARRA